MAGGTSNATAGGGDHDSHHSPPFFLVGENDPNTLAAFIGGFIVLFGFVSFIVKQRLFISETIVATVFGIIAGPKCLNIFNPAAWGDTTSMTYYFAQSVCAIQIMAAAINLPKKFWISRWKSVLILLGPVMIYEYIITAVCVYLILGIPFLESLIIASCTAPTDPVLANAIVNGRFAELHISVPIRHLLSGESAANDGLAIPMFMLPVLLLQHADHPGEAIGKWFYVTWLYEVGVGAIAGLLIGLGVRVALKFADMRRWIDKNNFLSFEIALAVFIIGFASLFGVASFLTTFTAGLVFAWDDWFTEQREEAHVQEAIDMLLNLTFFLYFGTVIPFESFNTDLIPIWKLCLAGIVVMIVRRVPIVFIFQRYLGGVFTYQEAFFVGWFGPVGVGALWYMVSGKC
ncbi:Cation/H+ exchanger [Cladochytrium replicatum]|nr:Cation/H+ exchanger [Cladochytrium replicatum]